MHDSDEIEGISTRLSAETGSDRLIGSTLPNGVAIRTQIGSGGNATVYLGFNPLLNRPVAVKILRVAPDRAILERFKNEARAAFDLRNDHICRVLELGITADGKPFLIMDYLEGENLSDLIRKKGKMSPDRVVDYTLQICDALECAHSSGIVHRDVKPSNIIASSKGHITVLDFGLAKAYTQGHTTLTGTGVLIGTLQYMSPEQCRGHQVDHRSDIYSLGITLYEMLTGKPPFKSNEPVSLMLKHVNESPPPIPHENDSQLKSLQEIVFKAMEKDPEKRYQSIADFEKDILAVKSGKIIKPAPFHTKKRNRKKIAIVAGASIGLVLASYLMYVLAGNRIVIIPRSLDSANLAGEFDARSESILTTKGLSLMKQQNYTAAEEVLNEAVMQNGSDVTALRNLLTVQMKLGKTESAVATNNKLLKIDPSAQSNWSDIAAAGFEQADVSTMIDASTKAIEADPKGMKNYLIRYVAARAQGDTKLADDSFRKAQELNTAGSSTQGENLWNKFEAIRAVKPAETAKAAQATSVAAVMAKKAMDKWHNMDSASKADLKAKAKGAAAKAAAFWKKLRGH